MIRKSLGFLSHRKAHIMNFVKFLLLGLLCSSQAHAYLSIAESGELIAPDKFQLGVEGQGLLNRGGGGNLNVFVDAGINDELSGRVTLGGGTTDFNAFGSIKYMPFPDFDKQPAMGVRMGLGMARFHEENFLQVQVAPLASKKINTNYGLTVPYIAIPFTYINADHENFLATNIVLGTEFNSPELPGVSFGGEFGLELNRSYTYFSLFATFPFDSKKGFGR